MKLGKRLKQIEAMVAPQYDHVWDCCCDHGLLGAALLSRQAAPYIHFVDLVPALINQLENKLTHFYPQDSKSISKSQWQVHCMSVSELPLQKYSGKNLVIIAGIGGDLMSELVKAICQKNPAAHYDFLLCPVHHQFTLRQQLIQLGFSLQTEALIAEKARYYEVLLVSKIQGRSQSKINPVGDLIWQTNTPEASKNAANYLSQTLAHYRRMELNCGSEVQHIIDAYSAVTLYKN